MDVGRILYKVLLVLKDVYLTEIERRLDGGKKLSEYISPSSLMYYLSFIHFKSNDISH